MGGDVTKVVPPWLAISCLGGGAFFLSYKCAAAHSLWVVRTPAGWVTSRGFTPREFQASSGCCNFAQPDREEHLSYFLTKSSKKFWIRSVPQMPGLFWGESVERSSSVWPPRPSNASASVHERIPGRHASHVASERHHFYQNLRGGAPVPHQRRLSEKVLRSLWGHWRGGGDNGQTDRQIQRIRLCKYRHPARVRYSNTAPIIDVIIYHVFN